MQLPTAVLFNSKENKDSMWVNTAAEQASYWISQVKFLWENERSVR